MIKKKVVISYPTHNRLDYCKITLPQVLNEAYNSKNKCFVYCGDDNSKDGTWEYLNTVRGFHKLEQQVVGNSIWQLNEAFRIAKDIGAKYVYAMANDILMPNGIVDVMVELMDKTPNAATMMVEEVFNLPYIGDSITLNEHKFTSSLGIHRVECYPSNMAANKRFFGFSTYQERAIQQGYKVYRLKGIGNTNLDGSAWSMQEHYYNLGYARRGLVSNDKSIYKAEHGE